MKRLLFPFMVFILLCGCNREGDRLFRSLDPAFTGIDFRNELHVSDTLNAFNFTNFYNGGGVGIADFNQDGIPDICFTANQDAPELYIGKGKLQFEKVPKSGLGNPGWVTGICIVDINQDGWPDIYLSMAAHPSFGHTANQLYINQKTPMPSFREAAAAYGLAYEGFTMQTVFFDYDHDGDLDAFLLNTAPDFANPNHLRPPVSDGSHPSTDKLFKNTGKQADGSYRYEDASAEAGIRYEGLGLGVALADLNGDGWVDIYCSNDFQSDDILYINRGDGTFINVIKSATKHTSLFGMGIDAADFNNDRHRDIFQLDMLPEDSERQKQMIARGDYEKKRLSVSPPYNYHPQYMRNSLQVNLGTGDMIPAFSEQGFMYQVAATDWSWSVLLADFDLDGWKDAYVTNGYRRNVTDLDFITYNKNQNLFGSDQAREANREKILQSIPEIKLKNYAFKNRPGQAFQNTSAPWGLDHLSYSNGAAYADLDLDGDLDLVVNNIDALAFVYENRSEGKNHLTVSFRGADGNKEGIGASVEVFAGSVCQLYDYFPARGYLSSMNTPLLIGLGDAQVADRVEVTWPGGKKQWFSKIAAGSHLIVEESNAEHMHTEKAPVQKIFSDQSHLLRFTHRESDYIDFRHTPTLQKMLSRNGPVSEQGDFNGDGRADVVIGGAFGGSPTVVFYQQSDGSFVPGDTLPTRQMEVGAIAMLDANQDGIPDIFVVPGISENPMSNLAAYQPVLFIGNGSGFEPDATLPQLSVCSESVIVLDANDDGKMDLLIGGSYLPGAYPQACESILLLWQANGFEQVKADWLPTGAIKDMEMLDIDQDGDLDVVMTGHWSGVSVLRKKDNGYQREDLNLPTGWWNCIRAADIDLDGDMDLILGNEGLNSIFQASQAQPLTLLSKDFNADGRIDPIWGLFLKGQEVTIHPLGTLTDQVVQYKKRFRLYKDYSQAGLNDLFTSGDLKGADILKATELRSGIARNDGKGNFSFSPLPWAAQLSPVQDILIADLDADGLPDILLAGNFYPNEPIFGQSDASCGVFLRGRGKGQFDECPPSESGLQLDGDVRKMLYLPNQKRIIVSRNQGEISVLLHR